MDNETINEHIINLIKCGQLKTSIELVKTCNFTPNDELMKRSMCSVTLFNLLYPRSKMDKMLMLDHAIYKIGSNVAEEILVKNTGTIPFTHPLLVMYKRYPSDFDKLLRRGICVSTNDLNMLLKYPELLKIYFEYNEDYAKKNPDNFKRLIDKCIESDRVDSLRVLMKFSY